MPVIGLKMTPGKWDYAEIVVMMPAGPRPSDDLMDKVVQYLAWRFPEDDIEVAPGKPDGDHDFMVIPLAGVIGPSDEITPIEMPPAEKLNEIADALIEFRNAGWQLRLN